MLSSFSLADTIIGFIVEGPYDEALIEEIQATINEKLEIFDKLNFYIEVTTTAEISVKSVIKNIFYKIKMGNRFEKVAVVTDRKLLKIITKVESLFLNAEVRIYPSNQRLEAIQWISH